MKEYSRREIIRIGTGLVGLITATPILKGCIDFDLEPAPKNYSTAIVFTHRGKELPQSIIEDKLCAQEGTNTSSYFQVPSWYEREAEAYNADFNMLLHCFLDQIETPQEFINPSGSETPVKLTEFTRYLRSTYPELNDYKFLAINHTFPHEDLPYQKSYFANFSSRSFLLGIVERFDSSYILPSLYTFGHEYAHLLGATDKANTDSSRACKINPKTGEEYDGHDIMCAKTYSPEGNIIFVGNLFDLEITEPTAREIGWR